MDYKMGRNPESRRKTGNREEGKGTVKRIAESRSAFSKGKFGL
jgi:hypothetical protein